MDVVLILFVALVLETIVLISMDRKLIQSITLSKRIGYDEAIRDILRCHWFWSRTEHRWVNVKMEAIDGDEIPGLQDKPSGMTYKEWYRKLEEA